MDATTAATYGFAPRGQYQGEGDANGAIEGIWANGSGDAGAEYQTAGETVMFWSDLTYANGMNINMIGGSFKLASPTSPPSGDNIAATQLGNYFPTTKVGYNSYIYVWGNSNGGVANPIRASINFFTISGITSISTTLTSTYTSIPVIEAYNIDKKIDDGLPQSGNVNVLYLTAYQAWWSGSNYNSVRTTATPGSFTTCFDNNNVNGQVMQYSIGQNNGSGMNCALSFKME